MKAFRMNMLNKNFLISVLLMLCAVYAIAQPGKTVIKAAGPEYNRSAFYQSLWGHNYRGEWIMPVSFPILSLDTAFGGLKPQKEGGGHQSKSLHLKTKEGKEYVMRSVDKTLKVVIPEIFHHTFVEHIVDDQISISHPYAALTVPIMADAAKIYHTNPKYFFIPEQPALDSFNKKYANNLYLVEERPEGDWSNTASLGNFTEFISSEKVRENIYADHKNEVDQPAFVKARLFDMFIGDWDRHEDQWKWAPVEKDGRTIYEPIPVDRDQPYAIFDGLILKAAITAQAKYLQSFDYDIPYPEGFSYERRNVDRFFTNRVTLHEWQSIAKELQNELTDSVIVASIHQLPPEVFSISGNQIIAKLKSRREHLGEYATKYYSFISKYVDVVGSEEKEYFKVVQVSDSETDVDIYNSKNGRPRDQPWYSRKFKKNETDEIRLYGLSGKDVYTIDEGVDKGIRVRVIAGDDKDSISVSGKGRKVHIYDDKNENIFQLHAKARLHLTSDSTVHAYDYDAFRPEKKGLAPTGGYTDEDRIFIGLGYGWQHPGFRKKPFAYKQGVAVNYSISQTALSFLYGGIFTKVIGGWDLLLKANYDPVRWMNFYGLGNETVFSSKPTNYYRMRTAEWFGSIGISRSAGISDFTLSGFYSSVRILRDADKFITSNYLPVHPENIRTNNFLGASFKYNLTHVNDPVVPLRGIIFDALANYSENLNDADKSFASFAGNLQLYIPVVNKISLAITTGAQTVTNTPEFYQYPSIGGGDDLRGYIFERFHGKTTFYNSNELRFITNVNSYFLRGKGGFVAFFDDGRVWLPGETSNILHTAYGAGILIAPFNLAFFDITVGFSKEATSLQLRARIHL